MGRKWRPADVTTHCVTGHSVASVGGGACRLAAGPTTVQQVSADDVFSTATAEVARPDYDRSRITIGIVHIGVGGFHRAHQALAVDRLLRQGQAYEWGICGVGLLPGDRRMQQVMADQDGCYTLVEKSPDGTLVGPGDRLDRRLPVRPGRPRGGARADWPTPAPGSSP